MPTISRNKYWICYFNIHSASVERNWIMRIPSPCYICTSEIMLEDGMVHRVTIACFHFAICYTCLDWMIWKSGLSPPASCIGYTVHHERICTCHFGIPPSWIGRDRSSRNSSQQGSVTDCCYWIKSCIYYTLVKRRPLLPHVVRTVAGASLPHDCRNSEESNIANYYKIDSAAVGIFKKPVS